MNCRERRNSMMTFSDADLKDAARFLEESIVRSYGEPTKRRPASNNASMCGHPCPYYLWALRARNEDIPPPDPGMPGVWKLGREAEAATKIALLEQGWNLHRTEVTFRDNDLDITGRLDWELSRPGHPVWSSPIPTEFKGCSQNYFDQLHSFEDCFNSPMAWVRLWPMQALVYAYLVPEERPLVCLLLREKGAARPRAIIERAEVHFDRLAMMGEVLAEVNAALRDGTEPRSIEYDPVWCNRKCGAIHLCPTMRSHAYAGGMKLLDDSTVIDGYADEWASNKTAKSASEAAWSNIQEVCRHYGLYDGNPGEERSVVSERWRYTVKMTKSGSGRLNVEPLTSTGDDGEA
jgi:hypothetical protein